MTWPSKSDDTYKLYQELQGAESTFYSHFEPIIDMWLDVCIMEGSKDEEDHDLDYLFDGLHTTIDNSTSYVFISEQQGVLRYNAKTLHIPADFIDDPTPYQEKAQETKRYREAYHANIERNRKIEKIANLNAEIDRIRATL